MVLNNPALPILSAQSAFKVDYDFVAQALTANFKANAITYNFIANARLYNTEAI